MEWLTQNWIWIAFAVGFFLLMRRGGMGCGHGSGRHHRSHGAGRENPLPESPTVQPVDPVSGKPVDPALAVSSLYRGSPLYFESRENRDRFEAAPDEFPLAREAQTAARPHRRRGC